MQNNQHHLNKINSSGGAYAAQAFDKQAVEAAIRKLHQLPNLLAIGTQNLDEVLRQDRLDYEQELRYEGELEANLRRQTEEQHLGVVATVHYLPPPETQAPLPPSTEYLAG
jgi:hypothetical protein